MKEVNWETKENRQLLEAFLALKNKDEAKRFLRDIMTEKEIEEFSNRLEAARLLTKNTQYSAIIEKTGLSSTTIARISKWLKGSLGGYRIILKRLGTSNVNGIAIANKHHHNPTKLGKGLSLYS